LTESASGQRLVGDPLESLKNLAALCALVLVYGHELNLRLADKIDFNGKISETIHFFDFLGTALRESDLAGCIQFFLSY
jgi:hypothetical protein